MSGKKQVISLEFNKGYENFLVLESYEYGTGKPFKTFSQAMKRARIDFRGEVKHYIMLDYAINVKLRIIDCDGVYNQAHIINP